MADLRASGLGGIPKGQTADRPSSPSIGDVFYNGTLGVLEIYTASGWVVNSASPATPTSVVATNQPSGRAFNNGQASVAFTVNSTGGLPIQFVVTPSPATSPTTFSGSSSPIAVTGLQSSTQYTYTVTATNNFGPSPASSASSGVTATTVPDAPTIGTATAGVNKTATLTFTPGATGGSTITNYKYSTDGVNYTAFSPAQTSSPLTFSNLTPNVSTTIRLKAVNANGDSAASSPSNSFIPIASLATGGTVTSSGSYVIHTFNATDTFVPIQNISGIECLVVAGGGAAGGGSGVAGGGGGAGGYRTGSGISAVANTSYNITVGAGGVYNSSTGVGGDGSSSTFSSITSTGGGGGGYGNDTTVSPGRTGGSGGGGGGGYSFERTNSGGAGTSGQGNNGGTGNQTNNDAARAGGGGGGAGAVGGNGANTGNGGSGGNGIANSITGTSVTYAGGGGGGGFNSSYTSPGGSGGGGSGGRASSTAGAANTGGGGGGVWTGSGGANGGSGVVILRYQVS